jgi:hypothetical protein
MSRLFFGVLSILIVLLIGFESEALASSSDGGFCQTINPSAPVCHGS